MKYPPFIISLTSYPRRINGVHLTIQSLLGQSCATGKIILWLSLDEFPNELEDLPISLISLLSEKFSVRFTKNILSYKKLIPAIKIYPDIPIITVDDDVVYDRHLIASLMDSYLKYPKMIHCGRCHLIRTKNNAIEPYKKWVWDNSLQNLTPSYRNFFTGVGGVLYPPHSLYKDVTNEELFKINCPSGDDIWFWAMALLNKTLINRILPRQLIKNKIVPSSQTNSLWSENKSKNDMMIRNVLRLYPELFQIINSVKSEYQLYYPSYVLHTLKVALYSII